MTYASVRAKGCYDFGPVQTVYNHGAIILGITNKFKRWYKWFFVRIEGTYTIATGTVSVIAGNQIPPRRVDACNGVVPLDENVQRLVDLNSTVFRRVQAIFIFTVGGRRVKYFECCVYPNRVLCASKMTVVFDGYFVLLSRSVETTVVCVDFRTPAPVFVIEFRTRTKIRYSFFHENGGHAAARGFRMHQTSPTGGCFDRRRRRRRRLAARPCVNHSIQTNAQNFTDCARA